MKNKILNLLLIAALFASGSLFAQDVPNSGSRSTVVNVCRVPGSAKVNVNDKLDPASTYAVSKDNNGGPTVGEGSLKLIDGIINSKFMAHDYSTATCWGGEKGIWIYFDALEKFVVDSYTIWTGNDADARDPYRWRLFGSNVENPNRDAIGDWTLLHKEDGRDLPGRQTEHKFSFSNTVAYQHYLWRIDANKGTSLFQVSEFQLWGYTINADLPATYGAVAAGTSVKMTAAVSSETATYKYKWVNPITKEVLGTTKTLTVNPDATTAYDFITEDTASGMTMTLTTTVVVKSDGAEAVVADLEAYSATKGGFMASESYTKGVSQLNETSFVDGTYKFNIVGLDQIGRGGYGFALSNVTGGAYVDGAEISDFTATGGRGANSSETYLVANTAYKSARMTFTNAGSTGTTIKGIMVNTIASMKNSIQTGEGIGGTPFEAGDWVKVVFTSIDVDNKSKVVEAYLADYRDEDPEAWDLNDTWRWVDLRTLGSGLVALDVSVQSNKSQISKVVALDNVGMMASEEPFQWTLKINGQEWDPKNTYAIEPSTVSQDFKVEFSSSTHDILLFSNDRRVKSRQFSVTMAKPVVNLYKIVLSSYETAHKESFDLILEQKFAFEDIVEVLWNNTLMLNLKKLGEDGYYFSSFQWYKDGEAIQGAEKATYSVGAKSSEKLDSSAKYMVEMYAGNNEYYHTNDVSVTLKGQNVKVYPNPATVGEVVSVEADVDQAYLAGAVLEVYNLSGIIVAKQKVTGNVTALNLPAAAGTYIVKLKGAEGFTRELKVIVK